MSALRKQADPHSTASPVEAAPVEYVAPIDRQEQEIADSDLPTSPAILLQQRLAARLAQVEAIAAETQDVVDVTIVKWPMPLRVATIVALSLALWAGVVLTAMTVIT